MVCCFIFSFVSRPGDFIAEKVININLDVEIPLTKKLNSWETSEGGSTETRGVLPEKVGGGVWSASQSPYPI